jgi:flavodoxin I
MKALIVYDSAYGNTEKVAKAIGSTITGDIEVLRVCEANPAEIHSLDLLVVGSPTQGGRATKPIQDFLNKLPDSALKGLNVAAFDTRFSIKIAKIFGYAAEKIANSLKAKGGNLITPTAAFFVTGKEGPLKEGELELAASWGKELEKGKK